LVSANTLRDINGVNAHRSSVKPLKRLKEQALGIHTTDTQNKQIPEAGQAASLPCVKNKQK